MPSEIKQYKFQASKNVISESSDTSSGSTILNVRRASSASTYQIAKFTIALHEHDENRDYFFELNQKLKGRKIANSPPTTVKEAVNSGG